MIRHGEARTRHNYKQWGGGGVVAQLHFSAVNWAHLSLSGQMSPPAAHVCPPAESPWLYGDGCPLHPAIMHTLGVYCGADRKSGGGITLELEWPILQRGVFQELLF